MNAMKGYSLLLLLFCPLFIYAQPCANLEAATSYPELSYRERGNRCEGLYRALVSQNDFQVVSFTVGKLKYKPDSAEIIKLSLPFATQNPIQILGAGIPLDLYYRMDAQLLPNQTFQWNSAAILIQHERTKSYRNIGVLGYEGSENDPTFIPLKVTTSLSRNDLKSYLKLVASTRISQVRWKIRNHPTYGTFQLLKNGLPFRKGKPITIELPQTLESGVYTVDVEGKEYNGTEKVFKRLQIKI